MTTSCVKCGGTLAEGQAFCASCGTRRSEPAAQPAPRYCVGCGSALASSARFCEKCGTAVGSHPSVPAPAGPAQVTPGPQHTPVTEISKNVAPPAPKKSRGLGFKIFLVAACFLVLGMLAFGAGVVYLGFRAKKKVAAVEQAYKHDDLSGMISAVKGQEDKPQPLPDWKPAPQELASSPTAKIPLRESLKFIHVGSDELRGDFESIFIVDKVTDQFIHVYASQEFPSGDALQKMLGQGLKNEDSRRIECGRTVFLTDMQSSAEMDFFFCREKREEQHPGTTALSFSKKTLEQLRNTGQADFTFHEDPLRTALKSFKNAMSGEPGQSQDAADADLLKKMMNFAPAGVNDDTQSVMTPPIKGTLSKVGASDLSFPVLLNDQPAEVPVMHVHVKSSEKEGDVYVLDDPDNPLFMAGISTTGGREQITKIYWDVPNQLEEQLEKTGRAKVYDIYFDFRSAAKRKESDPVLAEIAKIMHDHPDWKLRIEGYTDNIGGDAYNLDLSRRRAESVKGSLVASFSIAPDRLSTAGFGASNPVDTNDTIEGRARNRRVELSRQ